MFVLGVIILLIGLVGAGVHYFGIADVIPGLSSIPLGHKGFAAIALLGAVISVWTRRPRD